MKVKVIKRKGYQMLVCDDQNINEKYGASVSQPIELAILMSWEASECWKLLDFRLSSTFYPGPYLEGSNLQRYKPIDEQDAQNLKSQLHRYYENENGEIVWGTFDTVVALGDKTDNPDNPSYVDKSHEGCWSFKIAQSKFTHIREFWENFEGNNLKKAMLPNPYKQIDVATYRMEKSLQKLNNKPII